MPPHDRRTFNIADAGGGGADTLAGASTVAGADTVAGGGDTVAGGGEGGTTAPATVFADWTPEVVTTLVPEGFEVTPDQTAKLTEIVNAAKGSPDQIVKGMLSYYTEVAAQAGQALADEFNTTQTNWQNEMRTDPTYGGDKFDESLRVAKETAKALGGDGFLDLLRMTGAGNNVHMLRMLNEAAKYLPKEGTHVSGRSAAQPKSLGERMFGQNK